MKRQIQRIIARKANISDGFLSMVLAGKRRPSWATAKRLAKVTNIDEKIWLDGTHQEIRKLIQKKCSIKTILEIIT